MTNEHLQFRLARQRVEDLAREAEAERRWRHALEERPGETPPRRGPRRLRRILLALR